MKAYKPGDVFDDLREAIDAEIVAELRERLAFNKRWPYVLPLIKSETPGPDAPMFDPLRDERNQTRAREAEEWATAHLTEFEIHKEVIGIRDGNEALWHKMVWN